ncbi:hypothetical protein SERLA73DRAFT_84078 [Serpula lacrymans var. lacrymans S7.3]|uniref:F-box domain-containing protein n=2 Tax=Serpula lacrymans var. lacrymans TaxID=341189 RepID=F8PKT2_SERL3|nr:uncharacterized protein SERLADRAFT_458104 [Serpula lacrymans var. lacrymans S7.9]EGO03891.1 hypothetical protein SERLA73DRAFT_84078 [Serpula lacrymans var. lacrymans S7.3]EGO29816.1 hypothetical protein SERLADRAFT_458104 [Serpula lacrymans var. lacrymans S7.9]
MFRRHKIPPEITDHIIDHLHEDVHSLTTCSLVCKEWLPASRHHLFSSISLHPWKKDSFLRLVESPIATFAPYVRRVYMREGRGAYTWEKRWLNEALPRMKALTRVETLEVERVTWEFLGTEARQSFLTIFKGIKKLKLQHFEFRSFCDLMQFIDAFPALEDLQFDIVKWEKESIELDSPTQYHRPPNLRVLSLSCTRKASILNWIQSGEREPAVHTLHLWELSEKDVSAIPTFLSSVGSSLQELHIRFDDDFYFADALDLVQQMKISDVTELRAFHVHNLFLDQTTPDMDWVLELYRHIQSPHIQEVTIGLVYAVSGLVSGPVEKIDWDSLADILSQPQFAGLQSVKVILNVKDDLGMELIRQHFAKVRDRGILSIGTASDCA